MALFDGLCDGREAWEEYQETTYGVVISDWMMPEIDGLDLCKRIRSTKKRDYTYFIMLTARASKADFLEAMDGGADDYLTKPLETDEIRVRLRVAERILGFQEREQTGLNNDLRFNLNIRRHVG